MNRGTKRLRLRDRQRPGLQLEALETRLVLDSTVVFNEIMYNPPGETDATLEWIEFHNQLTVDVDISQWVLEGGVQFSFPDETIVPGRGYLVLAADPSAFTAATGKPAMGPFEGRLNNAGDQLLLYNNDQRLMNALQYGVGGDWPTAPDGSGASLAKRDDKGASDLAANWTFSPEYGGTPAGVNFPEPGTFVYETILPEQASARALVPFDLTGSLGQSWIDPNYDDAAWTLGTTGVGFDTGRTPTYLELLGLNLESPPNGQAPIRMQNANASLYVRIPFEMNTDLADVDQLLLRMKYDDGFVAYLNGVEVAHANAPGRDGDTTALAWLSTATGSHNDRDAVRVENFSLADHRAALTPGRNVLAIHALNRSTSDDDLLMVPEIVAGREVLLDAGNPLAFNEIAAGDAGDFWLEIANDGAAPMELGGFVLVATGQTGGQYTFPAQTLAPGGLLVVTQQQLGFRPGDGDRVFLYSANNEQIVDGQPVTGRLRGRSEQFVGQWLYPDVATPGAINSFHFQDDVVINEIMYHAFPQQLPVPAKSPTYARTAILPLEASAWRCREVSEPLPAQWAAEAHAADGVEWLSGQSPIGLSTVAQFSDQLKTPLTIPGLSGPPFHTYYFEHEFEFSGSDQPHDFRLNHYVHGGAVFFVNGVEVAHGTTCRRAPSMPTHRPRRSSAIARCCSLRKFPSPPAWWSRAPIASRWNSTDRT